MSMATVDAILDFAITREQAAHEFYIELAEKMARPGMKEVFILFASEELGHKRKLEEIKAGKRLRAPSGKKVLDLQIAEYMVDVDPDAELDYQKALVIAMKREKSSYKLYNDMAAATDDAELKQVFLALAQEEATHKLRFEVEYDAMILAED